MTNTAVLLPTELLGELACADATGSVDVRIVCDMSQDPGAAVIAGITNIPIRAPVTGFARTEYGYLSDPLGGYHFSFRVVWDVPATTVDGYRARITNPNGFTQCLPLDATGYFNDPPPALGQLRTQWQPIFNDGFVVRLGPNPMGFVEPVVVNLPHGPSPTSVQLSYTTPPASGQPFSFQVQTDGPVQFATFRDERTNTEVYPVVLTPRFTYSATGGILNGSLSVPPVATFRLRAHVSNWDAPFSHRSANVIDIRVNDGSWGGAISDPLPQTTCRGGEVTLTAGLSAPTVPLVHQWEFATTSDGPYFPLQPADQSTCPSGSSITSSISGVNTASLRISNVQPCRDGWYRLRLTQSPGSGHTFITMPARLTVGPCIAPLRVVDLGRLAETDYFFNVAAMTADGNTVTGTSNGRPFRWTAATGMVPLGGVAGTSHNPAAISADGNVICGTSYTSATDKYGAFRWTAASGFVDLGILPNALEARALDISADGQTVVGTCRVSNGSRAFRWTATEGMLDLGVLPGQANAEALFASSDGSVIVGRSGAPSFFRWTSATGMVPLIGLPANVSASGLTDMTADAAAISGYANDPMNTLRAFVWTPTEHVRWLPPPDADVESLALAISDVNRSVVGFSRTFDVETACMWTLDSGPRNLNAYLPTLGVPLNNWSLTRAEAISADGSTIVGKGRFSGQERVWIVTGLPASVLGACCVSSTCAVTTAAACAGQFGGINVSCGQPGNPTTCCIANFNRGGGVTVQDIFDFLVAYFTQDAAADINADGGITVQDIFNFIRLYLAGCSN